MLNTDRVNVEKVVVRRAVESRKESLHEGRLCIHREEEGQSDRLALAAARQGVARLYRYEYRNERTNDYAHGGFQNSRCYIAFTYMVASKISDRPLM